MSSGQYCDDCAEHYFNCSCKSKNIKDGAESITGNAVETIEALRTVLAQPEKEWVGLTDEEYELMAEKRVTSYFFNTLDYAHAIEAKLKEKNT